MKLLIVYYSKNENTAKIAEAIKNALMDLGEVEIFRIKMKAEYSDFALHLNPRLVLDTLLNKKPKINTFVDFTKYDFVIIGTPIWYDKITPPVNTLIQNAFGIENKKMIGFVSSTLNSPAYENSLRIALEAKNARVLKVFSLKHHEVNKSVIQEIRELVSRT